MMYKLLLCLMILPMASFTYQDNNFVEMADIKAFQSGIKEMAANTHSIKASFEQKKYLSILSNAVESSGTMLFKKPGLLKWSYTSPYNYAILLNGDEIKINDEGKINSFEIKNSKTFKALNDIIINSVQGDVLQEDRFNIFYLENETLYLTRLVPKEKQFKNYMSRIDVYFEKNNFTVKKLQLFEPGGDYTSINFQNKEMNGEIANSDFSFGSN